MRKKGSTGKFASSRRSGVNSQAFGRALGRPSGFQADIVQNFTYLNSSSQNVYTRFEHFYSFGALQILHGRPLNREKNDFSKADFGISSKNRLQAAVKI
jgi:hypothetical protein